MIHYIQYGSSLYFFFLFFSSLCSDLRIRVSTVVVVVVVGYASSWPGPRYYMVSPFLLLSRTVGRVKVEEACDSPFSLRTTVRDGTRAILSRLAGELFTF